MDHTGEDPYPDILDEFKQQTGDGAERDSRKNEQRWQEEAVDYVERVHCVEFEWAGFDETRTPVSNS